MTVFRCPHCGAEIAYDPSKELIVCEYCGSEITVDDYNKYLDEEGLYQVNELSCRQCGARILSTGNTVATFCSFCGSSLVLYSRIREEKKPDYIIPFRFKHKKAYNIYREKIDSTLIAPKWMKDENGETMMRGIYMPFHIYRFTYKGDYEGEAYRHSVEKEGGVKYNVKRTYEIEAPVEIDYDFIPADGAASFPDSISRAVCPYSEKDMVEFELPYFAGYYADGADVPESLYADKMENLVYTDIAASGTMDAGGLDVSASNVYDDIKLEKSVKTAMFPVWFLTFRNKDKVSYAAVNGQTGEIAADIPISFPRYLVASVIVAGLVSLFFNLFFTITPSSLMMSSSLLAFVSLVMANRLLNDTYRRKKHYDDAGFLGEDKETIKKPKNADTKDKVTALVFKVIGSFVLVIFVYLAAAVFGLVNVFLTFIIPAATFIYLIVSSVIRLTPAGMIRKKRAPIWYKIFTFAKPLLAIASCLYVSVMYPDTDEYAYLAAMFAILMIILTAFDIVRAQNKFTMRDIPVFTNKRGGDR